MKNLELTTKVLKSLPLGFVFTAEVTTASMQPQLPVGSLITVKRVDIKEVKRGDIVMFGVPSQRFPLVHRVIDKIEQNGITYLKTKGDASTAVDPSLVSPGDFLGRVIGKPHSSISIASKLKQLFHLD